MVAEEVVLLNNLSHENIVTIFGAYRCGNEAVVVTEFLSGGELFEKVASDDYNLTEVECMRSIHQICDGVAYLHRKVDYIHKKALGLTFKKALLSLFRILSISI